MNTLRFHFALLVIGLFLIFNAPALKAQSPLDGFDPNANGAVRAVAVQADGKIIIGGDFTTVSPNGGAAVVRNRIARFNPDGTLDTTFNPNAAGGVSSIVIQSDGKILVGGYFTNIGGQARNNIARLDKDTGLADSFNPNSSHFVRAIAVQSDGKILAGGDFGNIGGQQRAFIARLDPTTGLADSFNPGATYFVLAIAVQADGKILVGGIFTHIGGQARSGLARFDATTGLIDSFNPNPDGGVRTIVVQKDGKILVGGHFRTISGQSRNRIARLDASTGLSDSFNPNAMNPDEVYGAVWAIAVQTDGKVLAGGVFTNIGGEARNYLARLDAVTGAADSFNPNANNEVMAIAVQSDGKVLAGGLFATASSSIRNRIARFERDGRLDRTLNLNTVGNHIAGTAIQPDGKIIIGGIFQNILGSQRHHIARLNTDGSLDVTFDPNTNNNVSSIAVQTDGKILIGGGFTSLAPNGGAAVTRNHIARLNADGTVDASFNPNTNGVTVFSIVVQADGKILIGGWFTTLAPNGGAVVARNRIARLNPDGSLDTGFNPNAGNNVRSIAVQPDGKIIIGGEFTTLAPNGGAAVVRNRIARLNANGTLDTTFDPNASGDVDSVMLQADGKILVGGWFFSLAPNGGAAVTRYYIARLNTDGTVDTAFNPNPNDLVLSIAVQSDGRILIGGWFTTLAPNGGAAVARNSIARLNTDGTVDAAFNPNVNSVSPDNSVYSIAVQSDGKILVSGNFTSLAPNGGAAVARRFFARLSNDTAALSSLTVTKTSVTLLRDGAAALFTRIVFELSVDNGANWTMLGMAANSFASPGELTTADESVGANSGTGSNASVPLFAPQVAVYTLNGVNLPTGQNILVRARGFYRTGYTSGSETIEDKVQIAFLPVPTAAQVSVSGRVFTADGSGLSNARVMLTGAKGSSQTVVTGSFGYFRFDSVQAGETYVVSVVAKGYQFAPQAVTVNEEMSELSFTALE